MSSIIILGTAEKAYGVLLQEIHARLAEVASQHTRRQLDSFQFVTQVGIFKPFVLSFHDAQRSARHCQAEFERLGDWRTCLFSSELYVLKLDIDSLARYLECPSKMAEIARAKEQAAAAAPSRKPVVRYKSQKRFIPTVAVA